jgi:hypothetical protein
MADLALANGALIRWSLAIAVVSFFGTAPLQLRAMTDDVFQHAVNYVFTGSVDPPNSPQIVDRKSCVVVLPDPKNKRYIRYYLGRFKMDVSRISKTYSGRQTFYVLEVEGDDVVVEYLNLDKMGVVNRFKSAQISLPGNIAQTEKALHLIFSEHCRADDPRPPF